MKRLALLTFAAFLACGIPVLAQNPRLSAAGTVINAATGQPLSHALVILNHFPKPQAQGQGAPTVRGPVSTTAMTDASGAFRFEALEEGQYLLSAQKPQFILSAADAGSLSFQLSASREGLRIPLSPLGVIVGRAVDSDGQPMAHVNVLAISTHIEDGVLQTKADRSVSTDDRGMYRLWNLMPGKYYIKAAGRSGGTSTYLGDVPPWYTADEAFAPAYSGGAATLDAATPIVIAPGTEATANLALRLQPAYKIRGTLSNFAPSPSVKFDLLIGDENTSASRVSLNANTGRFEIQDVVAGSYTLRATQGSTVAEIPVKLAGRDVNGLEAALTPAVEVRVTSRFVGTLPAELAGIEAPYALGRCHVSLHPATRGASGITYHTAGQPPSQPRMAGQQAGELAIPGVMPGAYRVSANCLGGYPTSALFGSQDILANPVIAIQSGVLPPAIEIVGKYGGGLVQGTLILQDAATSPMPGVLLVPQFPAEPLMQPALEDGEKGERVSYFAALAPGMYTAYGFSNTNAEEYRNPDFLRSLSGGMAVQVTDGAESTITITGVVR